jgi:hypothetical protein
VAKPGHTAREVGATPDAGMCERPRRVAAVRSAVAHGFQPRVAALSISDVSRTSGVCSTRHNELLLTRSGGALQTDRSPPLTPAIDDRLGVTLAARRNEGGKQPGQLHEMRVGVARAASHRGGARLQRASRRWLHAMGEQRPTDRNEVIGRSAPNGMNWLWREGSNLRPPDEQLRFCLGTYADISVPQYLTSVPTCQHLSGNVNVRLALDARYSLSNSLGPLSKVVAKREFRPACSISR